MLAPDVLFIIASDDSGRLLDLNGSFYAVTVTGAQMLQQTITCSTPAAVECIVNQYNVDIKQVRIDLETFLQELHRRGLLWRNLSPYHRHRPTGIMPFLILAPILHIVHKGFRSLKVQTWILLTLARLSLRLFGWSRTISAWRRCYPPISPTYKYSSSSAGEVIQTVKDTVRTVAALSPLSISCKERSLCCWALLRFIGVPATLVLGVNLFPLASHCWCEYVSTILTDFPDRCADFTPILRYD